LENGDLIRALQDWDTPKIAQIFKSQTIDNKVNKFVKKQTKRASKFRKATTEQKDSAINRFKDAFLKSKLVDAIQSGELHEAFQDTNLFRI
jgi:hypothetical protein